METMSNYNGKVLSAIIDFNFIVNTELGLIRFIRENFQDDRAFKLDILNKSDREILSLLYGQKSFNPLAIISTEENMCNIDKLYNSFNESYRKEIISRSIIERSINRFIYLITKSQSSMGVNVSIAVSNDTEIEEITNHFGSNLRFTKDLSVNDLTMCDMFYINDLSFFSKKDISGNNTPIKMKSIYIHPKNSNNEFIKDNISDIETFIVTNKFSYMGFDYNKKDNKENINNDGESGN